MSFRLKWTPEATQTFARLQCAATDSSQIPVRANKAGGGKNATKSSKQAGLFKQVAKAVQQLADNPRHPSLKTHEYESLSHPFDPDGKVFEAHAQNKTPGAYRIFWCYGPSKGDIAVIAITSHP